MQPVLTAAEARALDRVTMTDVGLPGVVMMEAAGRGVAAEVLRALATRPGPVAVVCGGGGNGGDGLVVARVLRAAGVDATAYLAVPAVGITGDAALHLGVYQRSGGALIDASGDEGPALIAAAVARAAIVVDALFGVGVTRAVEGRLAAVIAAIDGAPGWRVAIDLPSGLDADTGQVRGVAARADVTVTMAAPKLGIAVAPGAAYAGRVVVVDIGVPPAVLAAMAPRAALVEAADAAAWRRPSDPLTHKHRRGHLLVVAGAPGTRGAGRLAAIAALRAGAGLVTLAGPTGGGELAAPDPIMTAALDEVDGLAALLAGKHALAIGPGMPADARGRAWIDHALAAGVPCVIDAAGLGHLVGRLDAVAAAAGRVVLTPHSGEAARLLGTTAAAVDADRPAAVRALAAATRAVVLLKGPRTLVCDGRAGDAIAINPTGGPALATAGSGDVLAGIIAALAVELPPAQAALAGAHVHGLAAEAWRDANDGADRGLSAGQLSLLLPRVLGRLLAAHAVA